MSGDKIRQLRTGKGLKQSELAAQAGISRVALGNYERGDRQPPIDVAARIAKALGVTVNALLSIPEDEIKSPFWSADLEDKLKQVGCSLGFDEDNAMLWINYPDGTLEITNNALEELHISSNEYMRFKLEELKKKYPQDFRPRRGISN